MIFLGKKVQNFGYPFFVAEISCSHNGSIEQAYDLIELAKRAGADAVKIQCYDADSMTLNNGYILGENSPWKGENLYELYKKSSTPFDWIPLLFDRAKEINIPIFSSVYDLRGLEVLEKVKCPAYKIASFENNDIDFIKEVVKTDKLTVVSTGMANSDDIDRVMEVIAYYNSILLHCISDYPTKVENINTSAIDYHVRNSFLRIGYSDHTANWLAPMLAVSHGACLIEAHLERLGAPSKDSSFSYNINSFKKMKEMCLLSHKALTYDEIEVESRKLRRSLYIVKDIYKGEYFTKEHIKSYRPALGCEPYLLSEIIGKKAFKTLRADTPMQMEYVDDKV